MTDRELMQMALDSIVYYAGGEENLYGEDKDLLKALRERLAQPEPEPTFYVIQATDRFGEGYEQTYWKDPLGFPVYAAPPEPVNWDAVDKFHVNKLKLKDKNT